MDRSCVGPSASCTVSVHPGKPKEAGCGNARHTPREFPLMTTTRTTYARDLFHFLLRPLATLRMLGGSPIARDFRERLMLSVTEVNGCRMCSYIHTREALRAGVSRDEVRRLLAGQHDDVPEAQLPAVLFAHHWAETQGAVDPEAEANARGAYPAKQFDAILLVLHFINFWNHTMMTVEGAVRVLTFGLVGKKRTA